MDLSPEYLRSMAAWRRRRDQGMRRERLGRTALDVLLVVCEGIVVGLVVLGAAKFLGWL